jgi:uncharacterized membrane protein YhaH (DUF805 family)
MAQILSKRYEGVYYNELKNGDKSYYITYKNIDRKNVWEKIGKMIVYLHNIVFIYSLIALAIKRLRDMKQLVWWSLLLLIPYLNLLVYAVLLFARSKNKIWELD